MRSGARIAERLSRLYRSRYFWPLAALALILLANLALSPGFFDIELRDGRLFGSLIDVLNRSAPLALLAIGMSLVIATGGIDLSVGAVIAISGAVCAHLLNAGYDAVVLVAGAGLAAGLAAGMINGALVSFLGIQPIVATLVLMVAGRGIAQLINDGQIVTFQNEAFASLGVGSVLGLPTPVVIVILALAAVQLTVRTTALGLFIEAIGCNPRASRYAGIRVRGVKLAVYCIAGVCSALAGIVITADIQGADANNAGLWSELDAILAVVLGGASLAGGRFSLLLSVIGVLIIQALGTTVVMSGVPPSFNLLIKSLVIVTVLLLQSGPGVRQLGRLLPRGSR
jgi:ribose/xylose/arabinose/galactoside ABC-type transport system permease subunit